MNSHSKDSFTKRFERLTEVSIKRAPWLITLFCMLTLLTLYYTVTHLKVHTDTQDMIASHLDWRQDFIKLKKTFPDNYQSIVAIVEGQSKASVSQAAKLLYASLKKNKNLSNRFSLSLDSFYAKNQLLYLEKNKLKDVVKQSKLLTPFGSLEKESLARFSQIISQITHRDSPFNQDNFAKGFAQILKDNQNHTPSYLNWANNFEASEPYMEVIQIKPVIDYETLNPGLLEINSIKDMFTSLDLAKQYHVSLKLTGDIPLNLEELQSVDKSAHWAALAAFIMVAALLLLSFQSIRVVCISLLVLIMGLSLTAGFAALTIGHLNMISVAFAVLYIGLSIDFTIHIIMRIKEQPELPIKQAIVKTIGHLGPALAFCALTTACAFYAFIPTTFKGISELGIIAGSGMIISFIMNIFLLPALLCTTPIKPNTITWPWSVKLDVSARLISALFISAILASFFVLPKLEFNANPMDLRDPKQPSVLAYHHLIEHLPYPPNAVTVMVDLQNPSNKVNLNKVKALDSVKEVIHLDSFVPQNQSNKVKLLQSIQLPKSSPTYETALERERALDNLLSQYKSRPNPSLAWQALIHELENYQSFIKSLPNNLKNHYYDPLSTSMLLGLTHQLDILRQGSMAQPFTKDDLPEPLLKRWKNGSLEKMDIYSKSDIGDAAVREAFVEQIHTLFPHATGLPVIHQKAGEAVLLAFAQAFMIALGVMVLFLCILLRDAKKIILTLVPLLSACILTGALSALLGISFNFANIIALPLLLGIGIDNGIHLIHRFYSNERQSLLRTSTSKAVIISTLTTIFSFANLSFSSHVGMSSMGLLLALGMMVTFLCTLVFLPSLLQCVHGKSKGS